MRHVFVIDLPILYRNRKSMSLIKGEAHVHVIKRLWLDIIRQKQQLLLNACYLCFKMLQSNHNLSIFIIFKINA